MLPMFAGMSLLSEIKTAPGRKVDGEPSGQRSEAPPTLYGLIGRSALLRDFSRI